MKEITKQHNTTQHNTTQHNTTQHNTTQHNTTQQTIPLISSLFVFFFFTNNGFGASGDKEEYIGQQIQQQQQQEKNYRDNIRRILETKRVKDSKKLGPVLDTIEETPPVSLSDAAGVYKFNKIVLIGNRVFSYKKLYKAILRDFKGKRFSVAINDHRLLC
ncbi:MAG: hypothetical protein LBU10_00580 [Endomicrobium sp.]|jgi:hypothetical protein|nr:hypothetical protein [Endomicrobium sp.]